MERNLQALFDVENVCACVLFAGSATEEARTHVDDIETRKRELSREFDAIRQDTGLTLEQLAKTLGFKGASSIQRYASPTMHSGAYLKRDIIHRMMDTLTGTKFNIAPQRILKLAGEPLVDLPNATIRSPHITPDARRLPVYGRVVGGMDGAIIMNTDPIGYTDWPPGLNDDEAYGATVHSDSMEPRYFDGELVWVKPSGRVVKGDFVVVQIKSDVHEERLAYVKQFVRWAGGMLVLSQYNPAKEITFPADRVESVHLIYRPTVSDA